MIYLPMTFSYLDACDVVCSVFCLIVILFFFLVLAYVINHVTNTTEGTDRHRIETRCPRCGGPIEWLDHQCGWCGYDIKHKGDDIKKRERPFVKTYNIPQIKSKGKICKDCGAELVYREEYYSWYCPNCHSYQ